MVEALRVRGAISCRLARMLEAGLAKADITAWEPGLLLLGWAQYGNVAERVAAPLHARALVLTDAAREETLAYVCVDLCFVTQSLRDGVLEELARVAPQLRLGGRNVMLTATHTHSGPSGFAPELYFSLMTGGVVPTVQAKLVGGIVRAICDAAARREPARLKLVAATLVGPPIAFNRALGPYLRNRDARPVPRGRAELAVDATHVLLRVEDRVGRPLGALSTFPLHGTTVHSDHRAIHPDHKGLAAEQLDLLARTKLGAGSDFVSIFAQGAAGDVTPNVRPSAERGYHIGPCDDDFDSARFVAAVQAEHAAELLARAADVAALEPVLGASCLHSRLANAAVDDDLLDGLRPGETTGDAVVGIAMAHGTHEGPGPLHARRAATYALARLRAAAGLDPKVPMLSVGSGERPLAFGMLPARSTARLAQRLDLTRHDATFDRYARWVQSGAAGAQPWVPTIAPAQIFRIGRFALAGVATEPTTTAGARLRHTMLGALAPLGVTSALVHGYANSYTGYVTTPEEYAFQHYEGGYTLFGPRTLAAHRTTLRRVAQLLIARTEPQRSSSRAATHSANAGDQSVPGPAPAIYGAEELAARTWHPVGATACS